VHYALSVRLFSGWLAAHGLPATLDELTRSAIHEWLAELAETHVASIVWNRFKGLHRLCGWLVAEGELSVHPMVGMVAPIVVETPTPIARSLLRAHPSEVKHLQLYGTILVGSRRRSARPSAVLERTAVTLRGVIGGDDRNPGGRLDSLPN